MGEKAGVMIRTAIQSLLEADAKMAETVLSLDDEVDDMNKRRAGGTGRNDAAAPEISVQALNAIIDLAQPGAVGRPRDQHRRGCDLLAARLRRPA